MEKKIIIVIVGGKLQGTEAVYLAQKAGFMTLVIDKDFDAPARGLSDDFLVHDFTLATPFPALPYTPDLILPAIEDDGVLDLVQKWAEQEGLVLAFDLQAHRISSSKRRSDRLFKALGLPMPVYWPGCEFPVIVKPDRASGSRGVAVYHSQKDFDERFQAPEPSENTLVQEYLDGPSYSIEVMGGPGDYLPLQVTDLGMDEVYDCNRVTAPTILGPHHIREMEEMAVKIAQALALRGIMDLEVISHHGVLKVLEIDARLPSQTPMTVFWSTGVNMVALLAALFLGKPLIRPGTGEQHVRMEHIRVDGAQIQFAGEHIMAQDGPLHLEPQFFGADEAVTSFYPGKSHWVASLVFTAQSVDDMMRKRDLCIKQIIALTQNTE